MRLNLKSFLIIGVVVALQSAASSDPTMPKAGKQLRYTSLAPDDRGFDHLTYSIPENAMRTGPFGLRTSGLRTTIKYYYLYSDPKTGDRVAREVFVEDTAKKTISRVELELYKDKLQHGVQREWYDDGKPKSESPLKKSIRHGAFKHWDKDGKLVGWYNIINGKGVLQIYYSNGQLHREVAYDHNRRHGPIRLFYENGQISAITQQRYGKPCGMGVGFWPNGEFRYRIWSDCEGHIQLMVANEPGPNLKGPLRMKITYYVNGSEVSTKLYIAAVAKNPGLPKPLDASEKYKQISERTKRIIDHYKKLKRLKIPLEAPTDDTPFDVPSERK